MSNTIGTTAPKIKLLFPIRNLFYHKKTEAELRQELQKLAEAHPNEAPETVRNVLANPGASAAQIKQAKNLFEGLLASF